MKLIVAVDEQWGIGRENRLLFSIAGDMAFFKETTLNRVVVMGRRTLQSLPGGAPLKNRVNIVLTRDASLRVSGALTCHTPAQLADVLALCAPDDVFVIGGSSVYALLLDYCGEAYVTKVRATADADSFFPDLDALENWELAQESQEKTGDGPAYRFCRYVNRNPLDPAALRG